MATSKLLKPTNVTISIPEFTDQPDQRVNSNGLDKEADAINALSEQLENYHEWTKILDVTTTANTAYDVDSSVTYPTYGIKEVMFTLQRGSNGRTFASTIAPIAQFQGGALYAFGSYNLASLTISAAGSVRVINAVAIYTDSTHIEIAINANDEAIKARVYVR